jgi:hypothetical protein
MKNGAAGGPGPGGARCCVVIGCFGNSLHGFRVAQHWRQWRQEHPFCPRFKQKYHLFLDHHDATQ